MWRIGAAFSVAIVLLVALGWFGWKPSQGERDGFVYDLETVGFTGVVLLDEQWPWPQVFAEVDLPGASHCPKVPVKWVEGEWLVGGAWPPGGVSFHVPDQVAALYDPETCERR